MKKLSMLIVSVVSTALLSSCAATPDNTQADNVPDPVTIQEDPRLPRNGEAASGELLALDGSSIGAVRAVFWGNEDDSISSADLEFTDIDPAYDGTRVGGSLEPRAPDDPCFDIGIRTSETPLDLTGDNNSDLKQIDPEYKGYLLYEVVLYLDLETGYRAPSLGFFGWDEDPVTTKCINPVVARAELAWDQPSATSKPAQSDSQ
ncbi:hypothetical protein [Leucobacter sp. wl10]|uniref:hypothetical protein n=1 Tax=Leucobacter sp. wl10 TaxID=2304677 RepID=UPI000E5ADABE|nr:hypothetical protein [Leucobacter sp. wl10]RGE19647.1 hypothetical protein D1J51_11375 [Leucobacter sp. wl10]